MTRRRITSVVLLGITVACSAGRPTLPSLPAGSVSARASSEMLKLAADPYVSVDRQKKLFGRNLSEAGLLPVLIVVANATDRPLSLRRSWIAVALANARELNAAASSDAVNAALGADAMEWNQAVGAAGGAGYGFLDLGLSYLFGSALPARARAAEYAKWQFPPELELAPREHHRAFVYFDTKSVGRLTTGVLRVRFAPAGHAVASLPPEQLELPLDDLDMY